MADMNRFVLFAVRSTFVFCLLLFVRYVMCTLSLANDSRNVRPSVLIRGEHFSDCDVVTFFS